MELGFGDLKPMILQKPTFFHSETDGDILSDDIVVPQKALKGSKVGGLEMVNGSNRHDGLE